MHQALVVEFLSHAPQVDAFAAAVVANARASRETELGCRQFDACRDPAEARRFHLYELYELYDDEAAVQLHLRPAHLLSMDAATASRLEHKTLRRDTRVAP